MSESSLGHFPAGQRWTFDEDVTRVFDDMLERSIPLYEQMRDAVVRLAVLAARPFDNRIVVDLGASRGEAVARVMATLGTIDANGHRMASYHAVETSPPMLDVLHERFDAKPGRPAVARVHDLDLRHEYPAVMDVSVTLCVLTLQFTPIEYRPAIVQRIYDTTAKGGVLILVEKVIGETALLNDWQQRAYHDMRRRHGYSQESIDTKSLSLEGVLVPTTSTMNRMWLERAGFNEIDGFFRWMNFEGLIARKR